ncbi:helix-turn-helix domain-containing protein [Streptomyces sp. NPDC059153]|uniref:helix-turn-helix domain-containing protein n=1 Tax=Streptomyces sp. NPDC059153 TaxID=3346743 RepID=UPI0036C96D6F
MRTVCGVKADMGRRYRWYPTIVQEQVLTGWGHTVRALWNVALAQPCGRLFACVHCGHADDADHNASVEIEARARQGGTSHAFRAMGEGGSVDNGTHRRPLVPSPTLRRRRTRETQPATFGWPKGNLPASGPGEDRQFLPLPSLPLPLSPPAPMDS